MQLGRMFNEGEVVTIKHVQWVNEALKFGEAKKNWGKELMRIERKRMKKA